MFYLLVGIIKDSEDFTRLRDTSHEGFNEYKKYINNAYIALAG